MTRSRPRGRDPTQDSEPLELVLPDGTRVALVDELTIGRARASTLRLADPAVSRIHARISTAPSGGAVLSDAGSSYGTWLDGRRVKAPAALHAGSRIRIGDQVLLVDRRRGESEAGHTIVVPASVTTAVGDAPRVCSGYALKRLEAGEGDRRWVLENLRSGRFVRLSDADAELFRLLDGKRSLAELVSDAERRLGETGPARLMLLLASLGERGFLAGAPEGPEDAPRASGLRRLLRPRSWAWRGAGALFDRLYRNGGRLLFRRPALAVLGAVAIGGAAVFAWLVAGRYGTPFVVASKVGVGGIVFVVGRLAVAAVHETAHGLAMSSVGRRVREAGFKLVLVFPYFYVDTSEAWFEPRRRRIAVSAAGPASDLVLGGVFSLGCAALAAGALRDVLFQLAFGAYVASFFNLNPLVQRDGYHILSDVLREPSLRRTRRVYARLGAAWTLIGAGVAAATLFRYAPALAGLWPG